MANLLVQVPAAAMTGVGWLALGGDFVFLMLCCWLPSLKLTARPYKWMVGIRSFPIGEAYFQGLC